MKNFPSFFPKICIPAGNVIERLYLYSDSKEARLLYILRVKFDLMLKLLN